MNRPTAQEYRRLTAIAAILSTIAVVAAFLGAGMTAFIVLAIVVGPASFYASQYLGSHSDRPRPEGRASRAPHAG